MTNNKRKIFESKIEKAVNLAEGGAPTRMFPEGQVGKQHKAAKFLYQALVKELGGYTYNGPINGNKTSSQDYESQ
jgi:hypothetical protein